MSVYIKGMEMPETCKLCYLSEFDPGLYAYVCKPTGIRIDYDMAKVDRPRTICPLIPAADVRPNVRGEWITKPYMIGNTQFCSCCGENYGRKHNFCPNCGADMRPKEE